MAFHTAPLPLGRVVPILTIIEGSSIQSHVNDLNVKHSIAGSLGPYHSHTGTCSYAGAALTLLFRGETRVFFIRKPQSVFLK